MSRLDGAGRPFVAAVAALCTAGTAAAAPTPRPADDDWLYEVRAGDHLVGIAQRMLADPRGWRQLQRLNGVQAPRRLQPGRTLRIPLALLRAEAAQAEVRQVVGQVGVRGTDGTVSNARDGTALRPSETLETGRDGSAQLRFADGSQVRVSPGSRLTLEQAQVLRGSGQAQQTLRLQRGEVESQVRREPPRPRFEIRSPVLRLGARGTEFRASFDPASQTGLGAVDQGRVEARAEGSPARTAGTLLVDGYGVAATAQGVARPVPLLPAASLTTGPVTVSRVPVRLRWASIATGWPVGAAWQAQVLSTGGSLLAERQGREADADFGALADGRYRLRLRAVDGQGLAGREATLAFEVAARPEPPFLSAPAAGAVLVGSRATLSWARSAAAARYRLQLGPAADLDNPQHDLRGLDAASATLDLAPGTWFWRLASVRADGHQGPWSDVQSFELRPEPPPAAPSAPAGGAGADGMLQFRLGAGRPGDVYEFQLARVEGGAEPDFTRPLLERRSETPELRLEALDAGTYALRARIVDASGRAGAWGPTGGFDVARSTWWWVPAAVLLLLLL